MGKNLNKYLILSFLMTLMVGIYAFLIVESEGNTRCYAKGGRLNLENWNWSDHKIIELNGEWMFYPSLLKEDLSAMTPSRIKEVPHFWEKDSDLNFLPYGYGTYKLIISGLTPHQIYGLEILDEVSAYSLFVNQKNIASNGTVGKTRQASVPQWHPMASVFQADESGEAELVMEISNFDYYRGGFWNSISIGNLTDILADVYKEKARDMFLFVAILIAGFFNLCFFITYIRDKTALYFALFCFSMSCHTLLTGQRLISNMITLFNWHILVRLEYLSGYLLLPLFGLFVINLFEIDMHSIAKKRFFEIFILGCVAVPLIMPGYVYSGLLESYKWAAMLFAMYFIYLIYNAIRQRRAGSELMFFAVMGIIVSIIKEIFFGGKVSWVPFASLNFVICFSLITFQQLLNIIRKNEILEATVILDPLTGLYNRTYLMTLDEHYFDEQDGHKKYLMFLDLDHFKEINDTYGHKTGDFILQETGKRLQKLLDNKGIICRYGGDEFIIVVAVNGYGEIIDIAERIIQTIHKAYEKDGKTYCVSASIGITESSEGMRNIEALIKSSDEAMYAAKKNGKNQYLLRSNL